MNGTINEPEPDTGSINAKNIGELPPSTPTPTSTSVNPSLEDLTTRTLRFLSTASAETLGAVAVGLAGCTYIILGRVGLVLMGVLGGIVLHATWESKTSPAGSIEEARREKGLDIVHRILELRRDPSAKVEDEEDEDDTLTVADSFEGFQPEIKSALNGLVDAVIRDYVC